jgi:hypothetical protein
VRAIVVRELIVLARRPAWAAVTGLYIALLGGFVLVWSRGMPGLAGANTYEQQRTVQWAVLSVLLPWAAVRCMAPDRGDGFVLVSSVTATPPFSMVLAKVLALAGALVLVVLAGLPVAVMAQQMSAAAFSSTLRDLVSLLGLTVLVSGAAVTWVLAVRGRLAAWMGTGSSVGLVLVALCRWTPTGVPIGLLAAAIGVGLTVATATWGDATLRYCDD